MDLFLDLADRSRSPSSDCHADDIASGFLEAVDLPTVAATFSRLRVAMDWIRTGFPLRSFCPLSELLLYDL